MIDDMKGLMDFATTSDPVSISVAAADEKETLQAVVDAYKSGIARSYLTGNREWIEVMLERLEAEPKDFNIIHEKDSFRAAAAAVEVVKSNKADILVKGGVVTSKFLQAALGTQAGLKEGLFSDVEVYEDA